MTGSGFMAVSVYKGLTRNPKIGITPISVFPNIWRLGQFRDIKFGKNVSSKTLLNIVRVTVFTVFELFRENQLGWRGVKTRLMKVGSTLMKYVHTPLAKIILVPLGLTAAALGTDAAHFIKCHNFTLFPGVQILWKSTVSVALQAIFLKLCQNCAFPQISTTGNEVKLHYFMLWLIKITFLDQV